MKNRNFFKVFLTLFLIFCRPLLSNNNISDGEKSELAKAKKKQRKEEIANIKKQYSKEISSLKEQYAFGKLTTQQFFKHKRELDIQYAKKLPVEESISLVSIPSSL